VGLGADQDLHEMNINFADAGAQTLDINSPIGSGEFRTIRIFSTDLAATKNALNAAIANGLAGGGDGIIDSDLAFHPGSSIGVAIMSDHVLIRPTRIGDLNLDGAVTIADFIDLASNFNSTGGWQEGDL